MSGCWALLASCRNAHAFQLPVLLGCAAAVFAQPRIYVDAHATQSPHDGSDWCHAHLTLHEALAVAGPGAVLCVADGTYLPSTAGLGNARDATFQLVPGITLAGGYAGCGAPDPDAQDPLLYETVISGDVGAPSVISDNCYHVFTVAGLASPTTLAACTIADGNADVANAARQGGGMIMAGGNLTLRDCTFRDNQAQFGGGLFCQSGSPTLLRCRFQDNKATSSGGGLYVYGFPGQASVVATDCVFFDNTAENSGGAVRIWDNSPTFSGCTFEANHARLSGAAIAIGGQSGPLFTRCVFTSNRNDTLFGNWDCYGGALHSTETSTPLLHSCVVAHNAAYALYPRLSYGGAVVNSDNARTTLINCTVVDNYANIGHGIFNEEAGGVIVSSSVLWNDGIEIVPSGAGPVTVVYSALTGSWPGVGNTDEDPLLIDLRPQFGSPCIDAGDPNTPLAGTADLDGHARVLCRRVDMGAYETGLGDYDCNGVVEPVDFAHWDVCMTGPGPAAYDSACAAFDVTFDQDVDLADLAALQLR